MDSIFFDSLGTRSRHELYVNSRPKQVTTWKGVRVIVQELVDSRQFVEYFLYYLIPVVGPETLPCPTSPNDFLEVGRRPKYQEEYFKNHRTLEQPQNGSRAESKSPLLNQRTWMSTSAVECDGFSYEKGTVCIYQHYLDRRLMLDCPAKV